MSFAEEVASFVVLCFCDDDDDDDNANKTKRNF